MLEAKILRLEKPRCFVSCKQTFVYAPFGYIPFVTFLHIILQ